MKDFFARMMNSKDPTVSSGVFLTVVTVLTILYTWLVVSVYCREIQDIPAGVYAFAGLVIAGKVGSILADRPVSNTSTTVEAISKSTVAETKQDDKTKE